MHSQRVGARLFAVNFPFSFCRCEWCWIVVRQKPQCMWVLKCAANTKFISTVQRWQTTFIWNDPRCRAIYFLRVAGFTVLSRERFLIFFPFFSFLIFSDFTYPALKFPQEVWRGMRHPRFSHFASVCDCHGNLFCHIVRSAVNFSSAFAAFEDRKWRCEVKINCLNGIRVDGKMCCLRRHHLCQSAS